MGCTDTEDAKGLQRRNPVRSHTWMHMKKSDAALMINSNLSLHGQSSHITRRGQRHQIEKK
jgi:hypothetical protein